MATDEPTATPLHPLKDTKDTDDEGHFVSFVALSGGEDAVTGLR